MNDIYWELDPRARGGGDGWHPFGMPGVECSLCKQSWASSRVLALPCPAGFHVRPEIFEAAPVSDAEFRVLRDQVRQALAAEGHEAPELLPGDKFQPLVVRLSRPPMYDFISGSLGSTIVSPGIKKLFEMEGVQGAVFCPALLVTTRAGRYRDESTPPPAYLAPIVDSPILEMLVLAESGTPPGAEIIRRCEACGREEFDLGKRRLVLTRDMIPRADIFRLRTTLQVIITDKVRQLLVEHRVTNCLLNPVSLVD